MLRRTSIKSMSRTDASYRLYDFDLSDPPTEKATATKLNSSLTPTTSKKLSISTQSYSFSNSTSQKKRPDMTSSSCGGDSGVSDCESSSHQQQPNDISTQRASRQTNFRSSSSRSLKQNGLVVQDLPLKKVNQTNPNTILRLDNFQPIKSQLSISTNSAFTQIVKKNPRQEK